MRVAIVKSNRFEAESILRIVGELYPAAETVVCESGAAAHTHFRSGQTHLALVGLNLPDIDGLDLIEEVSMDRSVGRILVLSDRHDEHTHQILARSRIDGFFDSLTEGSAELASAIIAVAEGGTYFNSTWRELRRRTDLSRLRMNQVLSEAEMQVFAVIGDGTDDRQAAEGLGLSAKTVHTHRQRIMRKLDVSTRAGLMVAAVQRGVVRFTGTHVMRPGFERMLAERRLRSRDLLGQRVCPVL